MDIFRKIKDTEYGKFRTDLEELVQKLNKISLDHETSVKQPRISEYFPVHWEINQFYHVLTVLMERFGVLNYVFTIVDEDLKIVDAFYLVMDLFDSTSSKSKQGIRELSLHLETFDEEAEEFIGTLEQKIKTKASIQDYVENYFSEIKDLDSTKTILIPYDLEQKITDLQLPLANLNIIEFFLKLAESKNTKDLILPNNRYIINQVIQNRSLQVLVDKISSIFSEIDIRQWATIWGTLLDDLMVNFLIMIQKQIVVAGRLIVENRKITLNPLPVHIYKPVHRPEVDVNKIAAEIYEKTGVRTMICDEKSIESLVRMIYSTENPNFLKLVVDLYAWSENSSWYPDSLLNSFLKLFGFKLGNNLALLNDAFKLVVSNFENILIATYRIYPEVKEKSRTSYLTLVHLTLERGEPTIRVINSESYMRYLNNPIIDPPERLKKIKDSVEKQEGISFKACLGFDINVLSDSISTKNIENMLKMKSIAHQLPFVASIGALFAGMKALKVEEAMETSDSLLKITEQEPGKLVEEPLKFKEYFDAFLKKGILFISDEEKSMGAIRTPIYSKGGYLGLDMELIRKIIEERSTPESKS